MKMLITITLLLVLCGNVLAVDYTFGQYAADAGLTGNETSIEAWSKGITNLSGLANNYGNLTFLRLFNNQLTSIESGDFDGLTNLRDLHLSRNQITSIESGDFGGLTNLTYLNLTSNQLASIEIGGFDGLIKLKELELSGNQMTSIESGDFDGLINLTKLKLGFNQLVSIESGDFDGLLKLWTLELDHNQITSVEKGDFDGLTELGVLSLFDNQITSIESGDFDGLPKLRGLALSYNQITHIESTAVNQLTSLMSLSLDHNKISSIESGIIDGLTNLTYLNLKENQITNIESESFAGLAKLECVLLQHNQIINIESGGFDGLTKLKYLLLGNNQIEKMDLSGSELASIQFFDISNNPITNVVLANSTLNQKSFNVLMNGGNIAYSGIAELSGVMNLDMSGVNFVGISNLLKMYTMDDLEELYLADAVGLSGDKVVTLLGKLDSLHLLNVIGIFHEWPLHIQNQLLVWDQIDGNTLIIYEPVIPVADAGLDLDLSADGDCGALVLLDGSASSDEEGNELSYYWFYDDELFGEGIQVEASLGLGEHAFTLIVNNGTNDSLPDEVIITVVDDTPPQVSVSMAPAVIWPPKNQMVKVTPFFAAADNCSEESSVELVEVTCNQESDGDIEITDEGIFLRAKRDGKDKDGRIYMITYKIIDGSGNETITSAQVKVPHDQRIRKTTRTKRTLSRSPRAINRRSTIKPKIEDNRKSGVGSRRASALSR